MNPPRNDFPFSNDDLTSGLLFTVSVFKFSSVNLKHLLRKHTSIYYDVWDVGLMLSCKD